MASVACRILEHTLCQRPLGPVGTLVLLRERDPESRLEEGRQAEALLTVTDSLLPETRETSGPKQGLPGYTFKRAPGELWRSKFDAEQNVIVINNGHRDFVFAARTRALKLRYIARLFAKELVCKNFPGYSPGDLLERMTHKGKVPKLAIVVSVEMVFFHCAKCVIRSGLWEPEQWPDISDMPGYGQITVDHSHWHESPEEVELQLQESYVKRLY